MKVVQMVLVVWGCVTIGAAMAQNGPGPSAGWSSGARMYDPKTSETVSGTVIKIEQTSSNGPGNAGGVHLLLKTSKEEISVHLGPAWYVDKQALKIAVQDTIAVHGSRITFAGKPAIVAAEVKKGDQVLKLRDDSGTPLWRRRGRRGG